MKAKTNKRIYAKAVFKGTVTAAGISFLAIILLALAVKIFNLPDRYISIINQVLKVISVVLGTFMAVGRGGEQGYIKGGLTGLVYMVLGYGVSMAVSQQAFSGLTVFSDLALGAAVGAMSGALWANAKPAKTTKNGLRARATGA